MDAAAKRAPLDRDTIVAAAMTLADRDGVGTLTMRKLAEALGFKVMSLYTHVANKDELLAAMVDAAFADIAPPSPAHTAMEAVRANAIATREALVAHPWAAGIWGHYLPGPARIDQMEHLLDALARTGLSPEVAHHGFHAVQNHVIGYTLQELGMELMTDDAEALQQRATAFVEGLDPASHPLTIAHVHQHIDGQTGSSFELVLDFILDGLVRLDATT